MPIIGEAVKIFAADFPFLSKTLFNQIKGGQPIYCDSDEFNRAENRLESCAHCKNGSECIQDRIMYRNGECFSAYEPGTIPVGVDEDGNIVCKDCDTWKEDLRR